MTRRRPVAGSIRVTSAAAAAAARRAGELAVQLGRPVPVTAVASAAITRAVADVTLDDVRAVEEAT